MAFTVADFPDLLRLLEEHPEWRAELRRHVLTDELLELPALVRQLAEAQARTEEGLAGLTIRVEALAEAQARTEQRLAGLAERVDALAEAQRATEKQLTLLTAQVAELTSGHARVVIELGALTGEVLELRYRARAPAYFSRLARRLRVLDSGVLADRLDDAVEAGQLDDAERDAILEADIVLTGKRREDRAEVYVVVEVSVTIDPHDVDRAAERAALLARLGRPVIPAVAGRVVTASVVQRARERGVWQALDGRVTSPNAG
ncbi:MAG: hypothetical protein HYY05_03745 [Chloroflexi bacterium]|nr:hypothetical protein [Chloroflexota bacterium]